MNVLAIGNSFSEDATRYLSQVSWAAGKPITVVNLCIGGCSLERHYRNMLGDFKEYMLEVNGGGTGFNVTLREALLNRPWDVVMIQQVSNKAPDFSTYQPYLNELAAYIRRMCIGAKLGLQQTWAYEEGSDRLCQELGYAHYTDMLADIKAAYDRAAKEIDADFIIPSGEMFGRLLEAGIPKVHRDTFHASWGLGRYALALLWARKLTGCDVSENTFRGFDEPIPEEQAALVRRVVSEMPLE